MVLLVVVAVLLFVAAVVLTIAVAVLHPQAGRRRDARLVLDRLWPPYSP